MAEAAEQMGLSSVWVSDHVVFPVEANSRYPYSRDGRFPIPFDTPFLEAIVCMGFLAAITEKVMIGSSVLVLPLRNTILVAKQLASVAALAPGRLIVGLGVGWLREEFELLKEPFDTRGQVLDEQIAALRGLWTTQGFEHSGAHVSFGPVLMEPRPSTLPAIWIGGTSTSALRRAGRLADNWHAIGTRDPADLQQKMETVRRAAQEAGRDPNSIAFSARIGGRPGDEGMAILKRRLELLSDLGCEHVVVDASITDLHEAVEFYGQLGGLARQLTA